MPLSVWHSDGCTGRCTDELASLVDLFPTALEFAGVAPDAASGQVDGVSLLGATQGGRLPRRALYQEIWVDDGTAIGPPEDRTRSKREIERVRVKSKAQTALHQRAWITDRWKLVLTGHEPDEFQPALDRIRSPEEFARQCYHLILGRIEDKAGFDAMVANLSEHDDDPTAREAHVSAMLASRELALWGKRRVFDHRRDPRGQSPVRIDRGWWRRRRFAGWFRQLKQCSRIDANPGPPVHVESSDEQAQLADMLEALGYAGDGP